MSDARPSRPRILIDPDGNEVRVGGATVAEQDANVAALEASWAERKGRARFVSDIQAAIDAIKTTSWDFIDKYSPIPVEGSQDPGTEWPTGTLNLALLLQMVQILRIEATRTAVHKIKIARALEVILYALERLIERNPDITPPPDR